MADRQKLQAAVALLNSVVHFLQDRRRVGAGLVTVPIAEPAAIAEPATTANALTISWDEVEAAFDNRIRTGVITNHRHLDFLNFMDDASEQFIVQVQQAIKVHTSVKVNAVLAAEYMIIKDDQETVDIKYLNTTTVPIYSTTDLNEWFMTNVVLPIDAAMEEFKERDSGWSLRSILNLCININKLNPMRGNSHIELPEFIKRKKACVNVKNNDDQCFKWTILSALHPATHHVDRLHRPTKKKKTVGSGMETILFFCNFSR